LLYNLFVVTFCTLLKMIYNREKCLITLKKAFENMLEYFQMNNIDIPNIAIVNTNADEVIYPDDSKMNIFIQENFLKNTPLSFANLVFIHECIHIYVHMIPKAKDARYIKDCFGTAMIDIFDIDADVCSFLISKKLNCNHLNFKQYMLFVSEGQKSFPITKQHQTCRLIGSLMSIFVSDIFCKKIIIYPEIVPFENLANVIIQIEGSMFFLEAVDISEFNTKNIPNFDNFMFNKIYQFLEKRFEF